MDDLEEVVQLWFRSWHQAFPDLRHPQPLAQWRARFRDEFVGHREIWLAEVDGRLAGFAALARHEGVLDQLFVAPTYQGRGVGTALLAHAKARVPNGHPAYWSAERRVPLDAAPAVTTGEPSRRISRRLRVVAIAPGHPKRAGAAEWEHVEPAPSGQHAFNELRCGRDGLRRTRW